ncbi:MAG: hypothetical protein QOD77_1046 [Thermoplasmata archaeon]|nr:hypothetical protein [Thermoplasmata archaeon]
MRTTLAIVLTGALLAVLLPFPAGSTVEPAVGFGMDAGSIGAQTQAGAKPDYGTFWVGPWTLKSGWGGPDGQLQAMADAGVTPAVHLYYWGDDISQSCLTNGCWSTLHNAQKDQAGWQALTDQLVQHLNGKLQGRPAVIFLESEFNKADVQAWEPLDAMLADKASQIHAGYPNAKVVLSLGNWNSAAWKTWDRAAAAMDLAGVQTMRGSTRDSVAAYESAFTATLNGAKQLKALFGKPIIVQDLALSSHPEPDYLARQADTLQDYFDGLPSLRAEGVMAIIYRSWRDAPNMDLANYYGEAERHWGLAYPSNGGLKAAGQVWIDGVQAERARAATPPNQPPTASFTATSDDLAASFDGTASSDPDGDALEHAWTFGDGGTATGATATHAYAASGTYTVTLTVSDGAAGAVATQSVTVVANQAPTASFTAAASGLQASFDGGASRDPEGAALAYAWSFGDGGTATGATATRTYAAGGTYQVKLTVSDGKASTSTTQAVTVTAPPPPTKFVVSTSSNEWWIQVKVDPNPTKVEVKVGTGAWLNMNKQSYGWTLSTHAPKGTPVQFRATDAAGKQVLSDPVPWLGAAPPPPAMTATFTPKAVGNNWWVEASVSSPQGVAKVEARANGGGWVALGKTNWGSYAKSVYVAPGAKVEFRASSPTGATATSPAYTWAK